MNRKEYFETEEGQKSLHWKRSAREMCFEIKQEPGTKKSLKIEDKRHFRKAVREQLQIINRKAYRGDIILIIDYFTTVNNPPPLQTLSKNYLDLLHKSMPKVDKFESILFKDDSQIKILIANYHLNEYGDNRPHVRITTNSLKNFYEDIALANRILNNDFLDADFSNNYKIGDYLREQELDDDYDVYDDYADLKENKEKICKTWGEKVYRTREYMYKSEIQGKYLQQNRMSIRDLIGLYQSEFSDNKKFIQDRKFNKLWDVTKNYVFIASDFFDLGKAPSEKGESKMFTERFKQQLVEFKIKYPVLFPLLIPVSIIVLFTPPRENVIDLDNLARDYIVPFITEILKPPASHSRVLEKYQLKKIASKPNQKNFLNSLTSYQILHIPRNINSPINGEIKFVITNGNAIYQNVKNIIDDLIRTWQE